MKIHTIDGNRLTPEDVARWSALQQADPALDSPFFRPEFVQAVAAVRNDVQVAVFEDGGGTAGFLPFQRVGRKTGRPVGGALSDFQGIVGRCPADATAGTVLRGCGLAAFHFDHLLCSQETFRPHHRAAAPSPFVDLSAGFSADRPGPSGGSRIVAKTLRSARVAERQVGPVRFEAHAADDRVFQTLVRWKSQQLAKTGHTDIFAFPWVVELLDRIRLARADEFAGALSALYLGDRLAAVHLGMRCGGVLHYWFPAYDLELRQYSPGMIWFVEMARLAPSLGIRRIDLGKGDEDYKARLMTGATALAEGSVECRPLARALGCVRRSAARLARMPMLGAPARVAASLSRPLRRRWLFH